MDNIRLVRFLNRETSEKENSEILHWVSASEENRSEFRNAHQAFHLSRVNQFQSEIDIDSAWDKLCSELPNKDKKIKLIQLDVFMKIAVSVLIILTVGFGSLWTIEHFNKRPKSALVKFEAPKGEKSKIVLADGSLVWLNSNTILKYDALNPRKVFVQGEAYFEVIKDPGNPFEVNTGSGISIQVTGTKFNLRCYSSDPFIETTLDEGEVIITGVDSKKLAVLNPGQQARYNVENNQINVASVLTEIYSLWKNNELRFSDISFAELVPRIERWYGVSVKLDPRIGEKDRFTMTLKTESLRELLNMMQLTANFRYEINGSLVEIHAK
jgi:transmembrane sensor